MVTQEKFPLNRFCSICIPVLLLLSACAEAPKNKYKLDPHDRAVHGKAMVWPKLPALPRYMYMGELLGEQNFKVEQPARKGVAKVFAFLLGLGYEKETPLVLQRPQGGAVDDNGRIYVSDVSRRAIFVFDETASELLVWDQASDTNQFVSPIGVAMGRGEEILVADADLGAVFRLDQNGKPLGQIGRTVLQRPTGLARDPVRGHIYVSDTRAHDIKVFNDDGHLLEILGQSGNLKGELNAPTHIAFANDNLYVSDSLNGRIQVFDRTGGVTSVFGKRGLYVGDFSRPKGVAADDEGNIYVTESYFDHLLIYNKEGQLLLPIGGTGNEPGKFYLPAGVWMDKNNRIYVADMFNGRVSVFQFLGGS